MNINIELLPGAKAPVYSSEGAGGFDFYAYALCEEGKSGGVVDFAVWSTGVKMEIPSGYSLLILSRSGHGIVSDIRLSNCVGLIDSDYRGEIFVGFRQDGSYNRESYHYPAFPPRPRAWLDSLKLGDRIAQGIIIPTPRVSFTFPDSLSSTSRGEAGLGSTGTSNG